MLRSLARSSPEVLVNRRAVTRKTELRLRESNKLQKLRRIKSAAAALFTEKGFDAATTRGIARRARVAKGTLFLYASEKRALVFLLWNDQADVISAKVKARFRPGAPLSKQLISMFSVYYQELSRNLTMSRIMMKELLFYHALGEEKNKPHSMHLVLEVKDLVVAAQHCGSISSDEDPFLIARYIYMTHLAALRFWLSMDKPEVAEGIASLRRIVKLIFRGLHEAGAQT
jgi:AcrR family transcriptional regulator